MERFDNQLPSDMLNNEVVECPSCKYLTPDRKLFSACPRCGLILSKYNERIRQSEVAASFNTDDIQPKGIVPSKYKFPQITKKLVLAVIIALCIIVGLMYKYKTTVNNDSNSKQAAHHDMNREFIVAVQSNDVGKVNQLLFLGNNPNVVVDGQTPIEVALKAENIEIAKLLVEKGANLAFNQKADKPTLLQECIDKNLTRSVSFILGLNIPINDQPKGYSTIILAVEKGNLDAVRMLIERGESVNMRNQYGRTPLIEAARRHKPELVSFLIKHGAEVNVQDNDVGYSPLMWGMENYEIVKMLIDAGGAPLGRCLFVYQLGL